MLINYTHCWYTKKPNTLLYYLFIYCPPVTKLYCWLWLWMHPQLRKMKTNDDDKIFTRIVIQVHALCTHHPICF